MKALPVCAGCMVALWAPLLLLAMYPGTVSMVTGFGLTWSAAFLGGVISSTAQVQDRFIPALITGLWAGGLAVLFSPARESIGGAISTVCVYAFFAVLGSMLVFGKRRDHR